MKRLSLLLVVLFLAGCATPPTATSTTSPITTPVSPLVTPQADNAGAVVVGKSIESEEETNTMNADFAVLLTAATFLSLVANRLVEGLVTPLFDKFEWDKFALMYIAWAVGCGLVVASGINLFTGVPGVAMPPALGLILSGLVAGGGSNLLHELFGALGQKGA